MKTIDIIRFRDAKKSAFLFRPGTSANQRRKNELQNSFNVVAEYEGKNIEVVSDWKESCKNVYFKFHVYIDGVKKDLRALKKLPDDLEFKGE